MKTDRRSEQVRRRHTKMVALFLGGRTVKEVGKEFGVTYQRARGMLCAAMCYDPVWGPRIAEAKEALQREFDADMRGWFFVTVRVRGRGTIGLGVIGYLRDVDGAVEERSVTLRQGIEGMRGSELEEALARAD